MKIKHVYLVPVLLVTLLFTQSCKDDDDIAPTPKEITFGDKTISLENSYFYILRDRTTSTWKFRDYFISDGTYKDDGSSGWDLEDYDNATYLLGVELAVNVSENPEILTIGEYPQYSDWGLAEDIDKTMISYVYFETIESVGYYDTLRETDGGNHPPVVVSGGVNDGEQMAVTSEGTMNYDDGPTDVSITFSFSFEGTVIDKTN